MTPARTRLATTLRTGVLALVLPATLLLATPVFAADAAKVDELMVEMKLDQMTRQMMDVMDEAMDKMFVDLARQKGLDDEQVAALQPRIDRIKASMREMMSWEAMAPEYRRIYIEVLTDEEVDGAIAYYRSPAGASMMAKLPTLMQRGMEVGQRRAAEVMPRLMAEMEKSIKQVETASADRE